MRDSKFANTKVNDGKAPFLVPNRCRAEQTFVREVLVPQPTVKVFSERPRSKN